MNLITVFLMVSTIAQTMGSPHRGDIPVTTKSTMFPTGEEWGCGGIAFCKSFKPDPCNTCHCPFEGSAGPLCTKTYCKQPKWDTLKCIECMDGYEFNDNDECVESTTPDDGDAPCKCPKLYAPVCCDGTTFPNECEASCERQRGCFVGACESEPEVVTAQDTAAKTEPAVETVPEIEVDAFCATNDHCTMYNDGCNNCKCSTDGASACTRMACSHTESLPPATCKACEDGYELHNGSCYVEKVPFEAPTTSNVIAVDPEPPFCTLNPHCTSYNDRCNNCKCMPNGDGACTKKMCLNMDSLLPAQCTSCDDGYTMDSTGSCIADEAPVDVKSEAPLAAPATSKVASAAAVQTAFTCDFFGSACSAYYDGCNYCFCNTGADSACTDRSCNLGDYEYGRCVQCKDGYDLVGGQCTPTSAECGGFSHCKLHQNGCGLCDCDDTNGLRNCGTCDEEGDLECLYCETGYELNCNGDCVPERKKCNEVTGFEDCDVFSDFLCMQDPKCTAAGSNEHVCIDLQVQWDCTSDEDCHNGYECVPWEDGMKCAKYDLL